jgi:hypothetical protein
MAGNLEAPPPRSSPLPRERTPPPGPFSSLLWWRWPENAATSTWPPQRRLIHRNSAVFCRNLSLFTAT